MAKYSNSKHGLKSCATTDAEKDKDTYPTSENLLEPEVCRDIKRKQIINLLEPEVCRDVKRKQIIKRQMAKRNYDKQAHPLPQKKDNLYILDHRVKGNPNVRQGYVMKDRQTDHTQLGVKIASTDETVWI